MGWQFTVLSIPILVALVISLSMLGYLLTVYRDRRRDPVVGLYVWIIIATIVWTGFSLLKLLQTTPATKLLFFRLLHLGAAALPPLLFLFVAAFTDRHQWLRPERVGSLFLIPSVFVGLLLVNSRGLIFGSPRVSETGLVILRVANGPGFMIFSVYSVLLVVATLGLIAMEVRRVGPTYYPQALLIAVAVATPMVVSLLTTAGVPPFVDDRINFVPASGAVSVISFGVLLYRYRLVELPPLAYATAMKYSPDGLFVLDQDGVIVSTNDRGSDLLEALDGGLGASLSAIVPAVDLEAMSNDLIEVSPSSGGMRYYRVVVEPLTRGGRRLGWVVVFRDETEQQRHQRRLQQKNEQLELVISTISHDLRNPLGVANGYLDLAQTEVESDELDKVERAHARMEEIIDEVLMLAKAGRQIDDLEDVQLRVVVKEAWENVTTATAELSIAGDGGLEADPMMIQHVFENLFRNAVEHGGEDVVVTVGVLSDGFYVEDDGQGIAPERRAEVFDVGYTETADGTGFGLGIVNRIVTAHGWEIDLAEGTDGGARFEITGVEIEQEPF